MIFNVSGGGGVGLNYKVVGGTSAPSSPTENTIWVNTDTTITSHVISPTEPTGVAGMVWIQTGTKSTIEFNALKKNVIQVYPVIASQYVSGAWVDVEAKSYQGGEWVDWWNGELYDAGDEYTERTGGYQAYGYVSSAGDCSVTTPTITRNSGSMKISIAAVSSSVHQRAGVVFVANPIDLTNYSTLKMNVTGYSDADGSWSSTVRLVVTTNKANSYPLTANKQFSATGTVSVDVSTLTGEYYIAFEFWKIHWMANVNFTFDKLWLE